MLFYLIYNFHINILAGCLKTEFDSTYPVRLNGIIGQDEFRESIENINRESSKRAPVIICGLIAILCLLGGIALFIAGGLTSVSTRTHGFPILVGVGIGVFFLGMLVLIFGCCFIRMRLATQMRKAIANESMKYSTRSPTPCSWRLHTSTFVTGGYRNRRTVYIYRVSYMFFMIKRNDSFDYFSYILRLVILVLQEVDMYPSNIIKDIRSQHHFFRNKMLRLHLLHTVIFLQEDFVLSVECHDKILRRDFVRRVVNRFVSRKYYRH
jgi:hypothetical protein